MNYAVNKIVCCFCIFMVYNKPITTKGVQLMKNSESIKNLIKIAKGEKKPDLVLKNCNVIDVFCGKIKKCDIAITDNIIVGLGEYNCDNIIDLTGKYVMPGFIDSHVHIESSLLTPEGYAQAVIPRGVTTVVADPHEIANVCGIKGIEYMKKAGETVPLDICFALPSCVPATPFDSSGAVIDSKDVDSLINNGDYIALAEMMNYVGLLNCDDEVINKLISANVVIDGHAPMVQGKDLSAYAVAGVKTDHECTNKKEALEKISNGMYIHIRQGTGSQNLDELIKAINHYNADRFTFCTDDKHFDLILEEGTISNCINMAVDRGVDFITAVKIASINSARCYSMKNKGAIAPGYIADLVVTDDMNAKNILKVFKNGRLVAEEGRALFNSDIYKDQAVYNTVNIKPISKTDFDIDFNKEIPAISIKPFTLITKPVYCENSNELNQCAVIERYKASGNIGKGFVKGSNIKGGAIAQTIGHDSHNITVLGDNSDDMQVAVNALGTDGGIAVVSAGEVKAYLPLNVAGLMSDKNIDELLFVYKSILEEIRKLTDYNPGQLLMILSFLSLVVIPELKLNDKGLFDVNKFQYL